MKNTKNQNINQLFEHHFIKEVKENKGADATIGSVIKLKGLMDSPTPQQHELAVHFLTLKRKYSVGLEYYTFEDLQQEFAGLFLFCAQDLEVLEDLDYLLANPEIYKQRMNYIMSQISNEFKTIANPTSTKVETSTGPKYVDANVGSINVLMNDGDGNSEQLENLITEEQSLFSSDKTQTHHNHFIAWFLENKERVLTKKQLTTFDTLREVYQPKLGNSKEENEKRKQMLEDADLNNRNMKNIFKNIKKRAVEAYKEEFNGVWHAHNYENYKATDELLAEYVESADFTGWNTQEERQRELNAIIQENYNDNEEFELIITKGLTLDEKKELVRCVNGVELASNKVLRKVNTNIKEAMKDRKPFILEASFPEFNYSENPFSGLGDLEGSSFLVTATGDVVAKDLLQTS